MPRIQPLTRENAPAAAHPLLDAAEKKMGRIPNLIGTFAHSPASLGAYLGFSQALSNASLSAGLREQIALTIAGENSCGYCASAHSALAKGAGVADDEITSSLHGTSSDPKVQAALTFASRIVDQRGWVGDDHFEEVRNAGYTDAEILEIIATVSINIFTNYANHVVQTENDFPKVELPRTAQASS